MKCTKNLWTKLAACLFVAALATACSNDDDEKPAEGLTADDFEVAQSDFTAPTMRGSMMIDFSVARPDMAPAKEEFAFTSFRLSGDNLSDLGRTFRIEELHLNGESCRLEVSYNYAGSRADVSADLAYKGEVVTTLTLKCTDGILVETPLVCPSLRSEVGFRQKTEKDYIPEGTLLAGIVVRDNRTGVSTSAGTSDGDFIALSSSFQFTTEERQAGKASIPLTYILTTENQRFEMDGEVTVWDTYVLDEARIAKDDPEHPDAFPVDEALAYFGITPSPEKLFYDDFPTFYFATAGVIRQEGMPDGFYAGGGYTLEGSNPISYDFKIGPMEELEAGSYHVVAHFAKPGLPEKRVNIVVPIKVLDGQEN